MRLLLILGVAGSLAVVSSAGAKPPATSNYTLVEHATLVQPGNQSTTGVRASSTASPFTWGAVDLAIPKGLTLRQLRWLSSDYNPVVGSCWGGSPRYEAWVNDGTVTRKIHFFMGPPPTFTGCPTGVYANSGNVASPSSIVDDSQLPGGSTVDTYSAAQAKYGSYAVTHVYLDVDGGWHADQAVDFDNAQINRKTFTFE